MRHLAALLCISMLLAAISACATRPEVVTVQQAFTRCPRPAAPELPALEVGTLPTFDVPVDDQVYVIDITQPAVLTVQIGGRAFLAAQAAFKWLRVCGPTRPSTSRRWRVW